MRLPEFRGCTGVEDDSTKKLPRPARHVCLRCPNIQHGKNFSRHGPAEVRYVLDCARGWGEVQGDRIGRYGTAFSPGAYQSVTPVSERPYGYTYAYNVRP